MQMTLKIGTRGSKLALAQAEELVRALACAHGWGAEESGQRTKLVVIKTTGDASHKAQAGEGGAKGLFVKELEDALLRGQIDIALHSAKDMLSTLTAGLETLAVLPRADPRDVWVSPQGWDILSLPAGAAVGTSSPRRGAQILNMHPDLEIVPLRGNVDTRLAKLETGRPAAAVMALAGLSRLGLAHHVRFVFPSAKMLPAVGQGALAVQARVGDRDVRDLIAPVNHAPSQIALTAERAFLQVLDGSCRSAIAGLAEISHDGMLTLRGEVLMPRGQNVQKIQQKATLGDDPLRSARALGAAAGKTLKAQAGPAYFET